MQSQNPPFLPSAAEGGFATDVLVQKIGGERCDGLIGRVLELPHVKLEGQTLKFACEAAGIAFGPETQPGIWTYASPLLSLVQ